MSEPPPPMPDDWAPVTTPAVAQSGFSVNMPPTPGPDDWQPIPAVPFPTAALGNLAPYQPTTSDVVGRVAALPIEGAGNAMIDTVGNIADAVPDTVRWGLKQAGIDAGQPGVFTRLMHGGVSAVQKGLSNATDAMGITTPAQSAYAAAPPQDAVERGLYGLGTGVGDVASTLLPAGAAARALSGTGDLVDAAAAARGVASGADMSAKNAGYLTGLETALRAAPDALGSNPLTQLTAGAVGGSVGGASGSPALGLAASLLTPAGIAGGKTAAIVAGNIAGLTAPQSMAARQLARALMRDGNTLPGLVGDLSAADGPQSAADLGGNNIQRLARIVQTVPGEGANNATDFLNTRQIAQPGRIYQGVQSSLSPTDDAAGTIDALTKARDAASLPAYNAFRASPPATNDALAALAADPDVNKALQWGYQLQRRRNVGTPVPTDQAVTSFNAAGDPVMGDVPTPNSWDLAKRGIDALINKGTDPVTGKMDADAASYVALKKNMLSAVDAAYPLYAPARATFGGPTEAMNAVALGRQALSQDPETITSTMAGMTPNEQDFYRIGAARNIRSIVDNVNAGGDAAGRLYAKPVMQQRIGALFDNDEDRTTFNNLLQNEMNMSKTSRFVLGGSPTGRIASEQEDAAVDPENVALVGSAMKGDVTGALGNLIGRGVRRANGLNEATTSVLQRMLLNPDKTDAIAAMMTPTNQAVINTKMSPTTRSMLAGLLASQGGGSGITGF